MGSFPCKIPKKRNRVRKLLPVVCLLCLYRFPELLEAVLGDFLFNGRRDVCVKPVRDLQTSHRPGSGRGGPDPAFPLLFHENPASRTFFIAIPNFVFSFPKIHLKRLISAKADKFKM